MPAIENPTLFARLRRTTMTELLRGRISSGHTPAMIIAASGLDASTKSLIADICKRTKLWNAERVDVARELVAHFADGKDAGVASDKLIRAFGDLTQAAKLIRRGKIRNRSLLWHAKRFLQRTAGVLAIAYIGLAIYFSFGRPTISVDYIAKLNEPILKVPQDQRAWPFYRQLADAYAADPVLRDKSFDLWPGTRPNQWSRTSKWVRANPQLLALLDQATTRPNMGFIYGPQGSASELKAAANAVAAPAAGPNDPFYNSVIGLLLPHLNQLRQSANLLACDAQLASEEGDAGRWMKRIEQLQTVADHSGESDFLVSGLVRVGIEWVRLNRIDAMFRENPDLLNDKQLAELAHRNSRHQTASDLITFKTERLGFEDVVQRIYTDDGHGDGRIAARGLSNMQAVTPLGSNNFFSAPGAGLSEQVSTAAAAPIAVLMLASRKDLLERYNSIMDRAEARLHEPWRAHANEPLFVEAQNIKASLVDSWRYIMINTMVPSIDRAGVTAERVLVRRDAINVGIALELFKRKSGKYPATLDELSPTYLPHLLIDPCDGKPMRYKLVDGKPVVYSVGVDLDDDGGIVPVPKAEFVKSYSHRNINGYELAIGQSSERYDGDWILYPEPPFPDDEDEDQDQDQPENPAATTARAD